MRLHGMAGRVPPSKVPHHLPRPDGYQIPDLVGRRFAPGAPDVAWCQDITYIPTREGWLYLASVLDLGSPAAGLLDGRPHAHRAGPRRLDHGRRRPRRRPPWPVSSATPTGAASTRSNDYLRLLPEPASCDPRSERPGFAGTTRWPRASGEPETGMPPRPSASPPGPRPAGPSSGGSTGTTHRLHTTLNGVPARSNGNSSTVSNTPTAADEPHNPLSGKRGRSNFPNSTNPASDDLARHRESAAGRRCGRDPRRRETVPHQDSGAADNSADPKRGVRHRSAIRFRRRRSLPAATVALARDRPRPRPGSAHGTRHDG